jgi:sugar lactone lactonase YvrE
MKKTLQTGLAAASALILGASAALAHAVTPPASSLELPDLFHPGSAVTAPDGRVFVASITTGRILVFKPGATTGRDFIDVATSGVDSAMGIKVDTAHSRLWACTAAFGVHQTPGTHPTAVLAFDLRSGKLLQTLPLPNGGLCNDLVIASNGSIVVTDSFSPRLLVLRPGSNMVEELIRDAAFEPPAGGFGLDGIVQLSDGSLLVTKNTAGELYRVTDPFGKTPVITKLTTSRSLAGADSLVLGPDGRIYLAEPNFAGTSGNIDLIVPEGSTAHIETVADSLATPVGIMISSKGFWPVEGRMGPVLIPSRKNEDPGKMRMVFRLAPKSDQLSDGSQASQTTTSTK